jgi:outer membrane protein OmpA-like peptidoglycan-associated protein
MKKLLVLVIINTALQLCALQAPLKATLSQALLQVIVVDDKNKPQTGQLVTFTSKKDGKMYNGTTDGAGKFNMLIPPAQKYGVSYRIFNEVYSDLMMELPSAASPFTFEYTITATPPRKFTLNNVFFDSGKSTLRLESNKELDQLAEYMGLKKTLVIEIAGHTDNVGAADANQKLSEDRANAVKQYLIKKGIAANRVTAKGYGDTQPEADNSTAEGRQKNRRTEVHIISE